MILVHIGYFNNLKKKVKPEITKTTLSLDQSEILKSEKQIT